MELQLEPDVYEPGLDDRGNYVDVLPPTSKFVRGLKCACLMHSYESRASFATHLKSKTHQKWVAELNSNKLNYFTECTQLRELTKSQKIIIINYEKELARCKQTIISLAHQLHSPYDNDDIDECEKET